VSEHITETYKNGISVPINDREAFARHLNMNIL